MYSLTLVCIIGLHQPQVVHAVFHGHLLLGSVSSHNLMESCFQVVERLVNLPRLDDVSGRSRIKLSVAFVLSSLVCVVELS